MRVVKRVLAGGVMGLVCVAVQAGAQAARGESADGQGAFRTGRYRNLFAESGHSPQDADRRLQAAFQQLFHGDPQTQAVYFESGANANGRLAYITDWANHDVRTEGMSYGMTIAVEMNRKQEFDAIWNWAKTYMYEGNPKHPNFGFFAWSCKTDGTPNEETPAPDGEEYFAMALYFASARWGDGQGIYDYHAQADALLQAMRHRARIVGPTKFGQRDVAAEMDEAHKMIRFVPGSFGRDFTDPSYHLPAFYELWARWGPVQDRAFWAEAAEVSRRFFPRTANAQTGLAPVYANWDGSPHPTRFAQSAEFGFDAWRVASNWSVDWSWWHASAAEPVLSDRIQAFFAAQGANYGDVYTLEGKQLEPQHSTGLVATNAVAGLAATDRARARHFEEALWNAPVPAGQQRYYDGMLYLLSWLHVSGNFRIWTPAWAGAAAPGE
jgi:oligosaccharide reducing-end xylanase